MDLYEHEQIQAIINLAPDAIIVFDTNSKVTKWNHKAEVIFGWTAQEVIGKNLYESIIPKRYLEVHKKSMQHFLDTGESPFFNRSIEIEVVNKQGKEFFISYTISSTKIEGKQFFIGFIRDITENKKALAALKFSENFLNSIIENIPNMIFVKDAKDLKFVKFNKAGEELIGYTKEELIGKNDYDFFPKEEADSFIEKDKKVFDAEQLLEIEEELIHTRFKGIRILETKKIPIFDTLGKPIYLLGISNDITTKKKIQTELDNKTKELARSNTELEQFAYIASHDLQEPLRTVTSYLELLKKRYTDKLDADANDFIHFAVDASIRMRTLIQSLLQYSRVNRIKPFEWINTNDLLNGVLENLHTSIIENRATLKIDPLPKIYGDHVLINQLFQNLIENAIKFKSKKDPEIVISCVQQDNEYLFSIKDNGIGIKKEHIAKLFTIFQRLHTQEEYPGTGIGLAICKKIVERHGGKIWIEPEIEKGSTFHFTINKGNTN